MIGYIIGGIIPAVLLGVYSILQKAAAQRGISPGMMLMVIGISAVTVGAVYCRLTQETRISTASGILAGLSGLVWAVATCLVAIGMTRFQAPISKLVPLYNMNTLVAVILGLLIFAEWKSVHSWQLLAGSVLIVIGGTLAATA